MAPFDLSGIVGTIAYALTFGAIGFGFGAALEMAGFGDTRKLSAQFYLKDMTVLKVMFSAIIVAAVLIAGASGLGLLDMSRVWVNPTYLWPGIVGGLIMGVGFVIGGFCPGTSLVATATLKIDGMVFLIGVATGVWLFGETVGAFEPFFLSSNLGRFTLPQWLGLSLGATVLLVVLMALLLFWLGELAEAHWGKEQPWSAIPLRPPAAEGVAAAALLAAAGLVALHGQPTAAQKFELLGTAAARPLADRSIFVHPAEVVALRQDINVQVVTIDLRNEHDFNLFHLGGARRVEPQTLLQPAGYAPLLALPASSVIFLVGQGEEAAVAVWKGLTALGVANLYIVEGGINRWLALYPAPACVATRIDGARPDESAWRVAFATGSSLPAAWPELPSSRSFRSPCEALLSPPEPDEPPDDGDHHHAGISWPAYSYTKHVKLKAKAAVKGGCG